MDVKDLLKGWRKTRRFATQEFQARVAFMQAHAALLDQLPAELSFRKCDGEHVWYTAFCYNPERVAELSARVRRVLGVLETKKQFESGDGTVTWVTQAPHITVSVYGGTPDENCTLIPTAHSYTTYEMQCKED